MIERANWDVYFMRIAQEAATRATCPRKRVGCVVVRDRSILSTGYNGSLRDLAHCDRAGCVVVEDHCIRTVHAEANAVAQAARLGSRVDGSTVYATAFPCWPCFKLLAQTGVTRVVYGEPYRIALMVAEAADALRITVEPVDLEPIYTEAT